MLLAEYEKRKASLIGLPDFTSMLFDQQLEVWHDPSNRIEILGGRRTGKSTMAGCWLLDGAARCRLRNYLFPYIAQSREDAKLILWEDLKDLVGRFNLSDHVKIDNSALRIRFNHNGCSVILGGCKDRAAVPKWQGKRLGRGVIDEAGTMPWLEELIDTVSPALMDVAGPLWIMGNTGPVMTGYWYERTGPHRGVAPHHEPGFHAWTIFENPKIPLAHEEAYREKERRGWDDDHPRWLKDYKGRWSYDPNTVAFPYDAKWDFDVLQSAGGWRYVLGVDVGHVDANAFVVWAANDSIEGEFIVESRKESGQLIDQFVADVRAYRDRYPNLHVVVDSGGMGKQHWAELSRRGVACSPADKRDKASAISVLHDRILGGYIHLARGRETDSIRDEWAVLRRKDNAWDLDDDQVDHAAHAALYGHRYLRKYLYDPPAPEPTRDERVAMEEAAIKEALRRRHDSTMRNGPAYDR